MAFRPVCSILYLSVMTVLCCCCNKPTPAPIVTAQPEPLATAAEPVEVNKAPTTKVNQDIRSVDFMNFTYEPDPDCAKLLMAKKKVRVKQGGASSPDGIGSFSVDRDRIVFGDLTGDNAEEAVVLAKCGYNSPGDEAFVFTMKEGKPILLKRLPSGAGGFDGIKDVAIKDGLLITERFQGECIACADYIITSTFRWTGTAFQQVGGSKSRKFEQ